MVTTGLIAIDATILATAVPTIVDELGGFEAFPWLFSVYLLAQAVSVPVYAKLSDVVGRKPIILIGIGLFLLGSILCGFAWSMPALIAFRAVQGLGAGAVQPMAITIAGDIYTLQERAKTQGYLASVWAISSVVGPTLGGVFSQFVSWRWIFFVNIPLCILAAVLLIRAFHEKIEKREHKVDYAGAMLLTVSLTLLILGVLEGGQAWAWNSPQSIAVFAVGAVLLVAFLFVERRAAEPVLPLWVFRHRVVGAAMATSLVVGVLLLGLTSYVPLFAQGVLGTGAIVAGFALAAMTIGWPIAAATSGRFYLRFGFRTTMLIGSLIALAGAALLLTVDASSSALHLAAPNFVMGLGFGYASSPAIIAAQSSVGWERRGVATGATLFARSVGSAVGVAAFGAIANSVVRTNLGSEPTSLEDLPAGVLDPAIHAVFIASFVVAVTLVVAAAFMPKEVVEVTG